MDNNKFIFNNNQLINIITNNCVTIDNLNNNNIILSKCSTSTDFNQYFSDGE